MKVLTCFWGLVKSDLSSTIENIKTNFSQDSEFMISTWSDQNFDESKFIKVLKSEPPSFEYLDSINFPFTQQIKHVPEWHSVRKGIYSHFYHNVLISEWLKIVDETKYDILIISRTDLIFDTKFQFDFSSDICYIPEIYWNSKGVGINDHFICGKFDAIKKATNMIILQDCFNILENSWNPETAWQKLIQQNGYNVIEFDCENYLLLPDRKLK